MKAHWGGGIAPRILDLGTKWRWVFTFMPRPLYSQGKSPWYPLERRLDGPQSRSGHGGEEKNYQPLPGLEPSDHPARSSALYHWATPAPMLIIKSLWIVIVTFKYGRYFASFSSRRPWLKRMIGLVGRFSSQVLWLSRTNYHSVNASYSPVTVPRGVR
jgi:hypothetical protein